MIIRRGRYLYTPFFLKPSVKRQDLAQYLNVCGRTVDRLVRSGCVPFIKLGGGRNAALRFRRLAVDEALAKGGRR